MLLPDLQPGDIVELRKPHPCGSTRWQVVRLGCGRRVMLPRRKLARRLKAHWPGGEKPSAEG